MKLRIAEYQRGYDADYKEALERVAGINQTRDELARQIQESRREKSPILTSEPYHAITERDIIR